ncbi:hypothetical protein AMJ80_04995, partial [bacterium SM23_31]
MQKSFVFDLNKCTGCEACRIACEIENRLGPGVTWREIFTFNEPHYPDVPVFHYSIACNHCVDAPCMKYCPALAITKDTETGAVLIEADYCLGCKYCSWVCPFDAIKFNSAVNVMEKCTFCSHRLADYKEPACVTGCPTGALKLGEYEKSNGKTAFPGFPPTDIKPAIDIKPLRKGSEYPEITAVQKHDFVSKKSPVNSSNSANKISLKNELPLVIFTLLAAILVAYFSAGVVLKIKIHPLLFLGSGILGMALSTLHLGKKLTAPRAVLNWKNSWISREIIFFSLFMVVGAVYPLFGLSSKVVGWIAVIFGFAALFSMDKVYQIDGRLGWTKAHSAMVIITALFLAGVFTGQWLLIGWFGFMKLFLYTIRKQYYHKNAGNPRILLSAFRIISGFILPLALYQTTGNEYMTV